MNLRTRYKRLKQYVEFTKLTPVQVFFDSTNLDHFRYKSNAPLYQGSIDPDTYKRALCVAKGKFKDEISKLVDEYIEVLPDGTVTLDVWLIPKNNIQKARLINDKNNL